MSADYRDRWITCTSEEIAIRGYYFPWGTKHIPYSSISSIERITMGPLTGRGRIWGSSGLSTWASLDPGRPSKTTGFLLELGGRIKPLVSPGDPDSFEQCVRGYLGD